MPDERVGIYLRISEDRDGRQTATDRQRKDCERYASARGWRVVDTFEDVDLSAYKRHVRRPEFERMLEAVRAKAIDGVLAWKVDRITRRQRDLVRLDEVCEDAGGFIATVVEGIDTRQPTGRFVSELLVAQARMESENMSIRIRRQQEELAKRGRPARGGTRAFGYTRDRSHVREEEAEIIRELASRVLSGESVRSLCFELARRDVRTPAGNPWRASTVRRMLMSAALSGQREQGGHAIAGDWPAILTPEQTAQLRAVFADRATRAATYRTPRTYLLTGLLVCGRPIKRGRRTQECGAQLVARPRQDGVRRYVCARQPGSDACGRLARQAEPVENAVAEMVFEALREVDLDEYLSPQLEDAGDVLQAIREDELALEQLARDHYSDRIIGRAEFIAARDVLEARVRANRERIARRASAGVLLDVAATGAAIRERWAEASLDWRRAVLDALIERIVLAPAEVGRNTFDPSLIRPIWRF